MQGKVVIVTHTLEFPGKFSNHMGIQFEGARMVDDYVP